MREDFATFLVEASKANNSIVCLGFDPVIEKIPLRMGDIEHRIWKFFLKILEACESEQCMPAAIKPNYAFFAQYGFEGLRALKKVCEETRKRAIPLIFDGKRGDIGKSSTAYAKEVFEFWQADAVTVSPYMGSDSVLPFAEYCKSHGKGVYVLNRTSNPGAKDFQDLMVGNKALYIHIADKIATWSLEYRSGVGAVVGATSLAELKEIAAHYLEKKAEVPLLIPGVGAQGGSAEEVTAILKNGGYNLRKTRINSSSGITYAYLTQNTDDFAGAAAKAVRELNAEIGRLE
jgi:orotidine-5'-phosphate decarboxylase